MKTQEEIEQLAEKEYPYRDDSRKSDIEYTNNIRRLFCSIYTQGYTQCQEDMADKKYTELQLRFFADELIKGIQSLILSLNKQD